MAVTDRAAYFMAHGHPPEVANKVCVDFDGTIVPKSGLYGNPDPMPGAVAALQRLKARGYHITILTSRLWPEWTDGADTTPGEQQAYIEALLRRHDIPFDRIVAKPGAVAYIDDLGVRFSDDWTAIVDWLLWSKSNGDAPG